MNKEGVTIAKASGALFARRGDDGSGGRGKRSGSREGEEEEGKDSLELWLTEQEPSAVTVEAVLVHQDEEVKDVEVEEEEEEEVVRPEEAEAGDDEGNLGNPKPRQERRKPSARRRRLGNEPSTDSLEDRVASYDAVRWGAEEVIRSQCLNPVNLEAIITDGQEMEQNPMQSILLPNLSHQACVVETTHFTAVRHRRHPRWVWVEEVVDKMVGPGHVSYFTDGTSHAHCFAPEDDEYR